MVQGQGDAGLLAAADSALAKIGSATPKDLRDKIAEIGLWASRRRLPATADGIDLGVVREAVRYERRLVIAYRDAAGGGHRARGVAHPSPWCGGGVNAIWGGRPELACAAEARRSSRGSGCVRPRR